MSRYITFRNGSGSVSWQIEKKKIVILLALNVASCTLFLVGLSIGSTLISPIATIQHLLGMGNGDYTFVIDILRLPRMIVAALAGAALGVSGLILQGLIRNPLASPDIIGITGGASFAAVFFITFLSGEISIRWLPFATIIGAGFVSLLIYFLAWKKGVSPVRLVLIGIGMAASMSAFTTLMIVMSPIISASSAYIWLTGSVYGANWGDVRAMLPWIVIFLPITFFFIKPMNAMELGDQVAVSLGAKVQLHRFSLLFISVALAGSAVAFAGGIGFVGLIAPHMARKLVGRSFGVLIPASALIGGSIVYLADVVARTAFIPLDIPAGVFVSAIGAPFFIYLLYRSRNQ